MRRFYSLLVFMLSGLILTAQSNLPVVHPQALMAPVQLNPHKAQFNKTQSCTDTVEYSISKLTGLPEVDTMDYSTYISGLAQVYHFREQEPSMVLMRTFTSISTVFRETVLRLS